MLCVAWIVVEDVVCGVAMYGGVVWCGVVEEWSGVCDVVCGVRNVVVDINTVARVCIRTLAYSLHAAWMHALFVDGGYQHCDACVCIRTLAYFLHAVWIHALFVDGLRHC